MDINEIIIVDTVSTTTIEDSTSNPITVGPGGEVRELSVLAGLPGPSPTLDIGTVTTGAPGSPAAADISGVSPNFLLDLTIPKGDPGNINGSSVAGNVPSFFNTVGVLQDSGIAASNLMTLSGTQTVSGTKTFSAQTSFSSHIIVTGTVASASGTVLSSSTALTLGSTLNDFQILRNHTNTGAMNTYQQINFANRFGAGSDWNTVEIIDGLGVDSSYLTPATTRTWIKRRPQGGLITLGDGGTTFLSMNSTGATFNAALTATSFTGTVAASNLSGTIATARLGSGTANAFSFLRGDQTWQQIGVYDGASSSTGTTQYQRIATIDGVTATQGANISGVIGNSGDYGSQSRNMIFFSVSQRGDNNIAAQAWSLTQGSATTIGNLYTKQISTLVFEVWLERAGWDARIGLRVFGSQGATVNMDSLSTTNPGGLVAVPRTNLQDAAMLTSGTLADARLSSNVATLTGSQTFSGAKAFSASTVFNGNISSQAGTFEHGRTDGVASTPYIDFHSGATATDYDSRIVASSGTGTAGQGNLTITASGGITFTGSLFTASAGTYNIGASGTRWGTLFSTTVNTTNAQITNLGVGIAPNSTVVVSGGFQITPVQSQAGTTSNTSAQVLVRYSADASGPAFVFAKSRNASLGNLTGTSSGDLLGRLVFNGTASDASSFLDAAWISVTGDGAPTASGVPGQIIFSTSSTSTPLARMTIRANGTVEFTNNITVTNSVSASSFSGSGASLSNLPAGNLTGTVPIAAIPTGTTGTTVALGNHNHDTAYVALTGNQAVSGTKTFSYVNIGTSGVPLAGAGLTLNTDNASPGLVVNNPAAAATDVGSAIALTATTGALNQAQIVSGWTAAASTDSYVKFMIRTGNAVAEAGRFTQGQFRIASGNHMYMGSTGIAAPTFTTRSAGTKIVLYDNIGASTVDHAIGIGVAEQWYSIPNNTRAFSWYAGTTKIASLSGLGILQANAFSGFGAIAPGGAIGHVPTKFNNSDWNYEWRNPAAEVNTSGLTPNGDMEAADITKDYSIFWSTGTGHTMTRDTTQFNSGTASMKLYNPQTVSGDHPALQTKAFDVSAGDTVEVSYYAKTDSTTNGPKITAGLHVKPDGTPDFFASGTVTLTQAPAVNLTTGWVQYTASFVVPVGMYRAKPYFRFQGNAGAGLAVTAFIDDIRVRVLSTTLANQGQWVDYTPTWTAVTTNPVIGNGNLTGRYTIVGKTVTCRIELKAGSTTTFGSGVWRFSLPFTAVSPPAFFTWDQHVLMAAGGAIDTGVAFIPIHTARFPTTSTVELLTDSSPSTLSSSQITSGLPFAWGNTDTLSAVFTYEMA